MKKILLVEDLASLAYAMRTHLIAMGLAQEVELCRTADQTLDQLERHDDWHCIFLDIDVPGAHGLSLVREVHRRGWSARTAVLTVSDNPQWFTEVKDMDYRGYLLKTTAMDQFNFSLQQIAHGYRCYNYVRGADNSDPMHLTSRQIEILKHIHQGRCNKEIAQNLGLSLWTVNNHVKAIIHALRAKDRTHAVTIGLRYGYIQMQPAQSTSTRV